MLFRVYVLAGVVLCLVALAVSYPVLRDIASEALERQRERKTDDLDADRSEDSERSPLVRDLDRNSLPRDDSRLTDEGVPSGRPADGEGTTDRVNCPHCGAENRGDYRYCKRCVERLSGVT